MLPHLGQGAAQSIEDAAALGVFLADIVKPSGGGESGEKEKEEVGEKISARLKLFSEIRRDRVTAIQILSEVPGLDGDFATASSKWAEYLPEHEFPRTSFFIFPLNLFPFFESMSHELTNTHRSRDNYRREKRRTGILYGLRRHQRM